MKWPELKSVSPILLAEKPVGGRVILNLRAFLMCCIQSTGLVKSYKVRVKMSAALRILNTMVLATEPYTKTIQTGYNSRGMIYTFVWPQREI